MTISEKLTTISENMPKVYEAGEKEEYDRFWDSFLTEAADDKQNLFAGNGWNIDNFKPNKDINVGSGYGLFFYNTMAVDLSALLDSLGRKLITTNMISGQNLFYLSKFTRVPVIDLRVCTNTSRAFQSFYLQTIDGIILSETTPINALMFETANALKNVTFEGVIGNSIDLHWSPLSKASITNVIEHLSDNTEGQVATFKKSAKEEAFTEEEWSALVATKPNWTITTA